VDAFLTVLIIIGFLSGVVAGMGIGGGTLLVPGLVFLADVSQHSAQGINLVVFMPVAISALWIHIKNRRINFKMAAYLSFIGALGAFCGAHIAVAGSSDILRKGFGIFLLIVGFLELFSKDDKM
jgi:uncharacterized membrane protein YfcA